jgi:hypothetical protein
VPTGATVVFGQADAEVKASGVTFPAAQAASSGANTLDDYEEGTWTPVLTDGTNNVGAYYYQFGSYIKVGRLVTVNCTISVATRAPLGNGDVYITGLPFTSAYINNSFEQQILAGKVFPLGAANYGIGTIDNNQTRITPIGVINGSNLGILGVNCGAGSQQIYTGTYWAAA